MEKDALLSDIRKRLVAELRDAKLIVHDPQVLPDGQFSSFYVDIKRSYERPDMLMLEAEGVHTQMHKDTTVVAARGYGGVPLATAISILKGLRLTLVREAPRYHVGTGVMFEGRVPEEKDKVAIVDDVGVTGKGMLDTGKIIEQTKAEVVGYHVVIKRGSMKQIEGLNSTFLLDSTTVLLGQM